MRVALSKKLYSKLYTYKYRDCNPAIKNPSVEAWEAWLPEFNFSRYKVITPGLNPPLRVRQLIVENSPGFLARKRSPLLLTL